jgi:uncharacterized protein
MRKALIVWGGWEGHQPEAGAAMVGGMLAEDGFSVNVSNDYEIFADPGLSGYDLIVPIVTNDELTKPQVTNLVEAVRGGVGLASYHGGLAAAFPATIAYHYLTGVQFVAHPGNIIDYRVEITDRSDPITAGLDDFDYRSEQYFTLYDPSVTVLATTRFSGAHDPAVAGKVMPVVFKRWFGAGRIFYSALGHLPAEFEREEPRLLLRRGLNWAARTR